MYIQLDADAKLEEINNMRLQLQKAEEECKKVEQVLRETKVIPSWDR